MQTTPDIRFDGWTVRTDSGELTKDGRTIRLRAQPMQVLVLLSAHPGNVVSREHLIAQLWPKGVVDFDTALNSAVRRLRRALGDEAGVPRYIETLPRRGYRFIAKLDPDSSVDNAAKGGRSFRLALPVWAYMSCVVLIALFGISGDRQFAHQHKPDPYAQRSSHPLDVVVNPGSNAQAREHYSLARYFLQHRGPGDIERARAHFEQTLLLDPNASEAAAGLASAYWFLITDNAISPEAGAAQLRSAAERALKLDPNSAEAHRRLVNYAFVTGTPVREEDARAIHHIDPTSAIAFSTRSERALDEGRLDESIEFARYAAMAEPLTLVYRYNLAWTLFLAGHFEEAKQTNLEVLEMNPAFKADVAAQAMILLGQCDEALQIASLWPESPERRETIALAYYAMHHFTEADEALARLVRADETNDPLRVAEVYAFRGESDEAFRWLDKSSEVFRDPHRRVVAGVSPETIRFSPFLRSLRQEAQWERWSASMFAKQ